MDCFASLAMTAREMSAPFPSPLVGEGGIGGRRPPYLEKDADACIGYGRAAAARRMSGLSQREGSVFVERTPHPALRATFSHKGRREERRRISARHHPPTVFDPHGEERVARLEPCRPQTGLHPSRRARCALLRMRSGMCDVLCDCPTGKSLKTCPAPCIKIFRFAPTPNHPYNSGHPAPTRGAYRDRHGRWVRGAVAAKRRARKQVFVGRAFSL
jgi:hypothetical protein